MMMLLQGSQSITLHVGGTHERSQVQAPPMATFLVPILSCLDIRRLIYIMTKPRHFRIRLAGFMNLKFFSLEIK